MLTPPALQNLTDVMKMMAETERLIAELYRACAQIWVEDRDFWLETVAAEERHADNIETMAGIMAARPERFELGRSFNPMAIKTIKTGLEGNLERLKKGDISREKMLNLARDIEASVIEKSYNEIVRTKDLEFQALVIEIVSETVSHRKQFEDRVRALKAGR